MWKRRLSRWHIVALGIAAWIVVWSIDFEHDRTTQLSPHLTLVERVHSDRRAYVGMVESTGSFFFPFPAAQEKVVGKRVMRGSTTVWAGEGLEVERRLAPSPDERYLLVWEMVPLPQYRWRILDTSGGRAITLRELVPLRVDPTGIPDIPGYLVHFRGWSPDSRSVNAMTTQVEYAPVPSGGTGIPTFIRELWTIDASSGAATRTRRCERPNNEWTDGPCADLPGAAGAPSRSAGAA